MRRFYKEVTLETPAAGGFTVLLDDRPVRTPGRLLLEIPGPALAAEIAAEWARQQEKIVPDDMPLTQIVATALDRVQPDRENYADRIAAYAETDLLCYRAAAPVELVEHQARHWQPLVEWADKTLAAPLTVTEGVAPVPQAPAVLKNIRDAVAAHDLYELAALGIATAAGGSVVVALALMQGRLDAAAAFDVCHLDELWQAERWGDDAEAAAYRDLKRRDLESVARFLALHRGDNGPLA